MKKKVMIGALVVFAILFVLWFIGTHVAPAKTPDFSQALNYSYIKTESGELNGKTITDRYIKLMPDPTINTNFTKVELAQTAIEAALKLKEEDPEADIIKIWLIPGKQFIGAGAIAKAFYVPEGEDAGGSKCPIWEVDAISSDVSRDDWKEMQRKGIFGKFIGMTGYTIQ